VLAAQRFDPSHQRADCDVAVRDAHSDRHDFQLAPSCLVENLVGVAARS
jgi:hypothetical protein